MDRKVMNAFIKAILVALLGCISVSPAVGSQNFTVQFAVVLYSDSTSTEATSTYSTVDSTIPDDDINATDMTSEETSSFQTILTGMKKRRAPLEITAMGRKLQNYVAGMEVQHDETLNFLNEVYNNTTDFLGFINVQWTVNTICGAEDVCCYDVNYNWTELKLNFSELVPALIRSQELIEDTGENFNINTEETANLPINKVDGITEQVACTAYELEEGCSSGFISDGVCVYNSNLELAYCSCSGWGLMNDSFVSSDGKCHSVDVIIAITVGGVSLILLILLITICCLSCNIAKLEDEVENLKESQDDEYLFSDPPKEQTVQNPAYEKNWQNPVLMSDVQAADTLDSSTDDAHPQLNGYHKYGAKKRDSDLYMPEPHEMGAYNKSYLPEPGAPWESTVTNSQDMTESEAYKNFKASLDHIDPNANYNIRRPNLSIRPTNGMYEVPKRSDVPSFRI